MIPLRDSVASRRVPIMTIGLILANVVMFIQQIRLGPHLNSFVDRYAVIPTFYLRWPQSSWQGMSEHQLPLVSALFLHGGWFHLVGNMWYLWIFGDNVEEVFGSIRFLFFYVVCGIAGNLAHILMNSRSATPALGASGCIAGVLAAYFLLFPGRKITTLLPIVIFWTIADVPAFFFLGIWFLMQFASGFFSLSYAQSGPGIAWWAHIAGFLSGLWLTFRAAARRRRK